MSSQKESQSQSQSPWKLHRNNPHKSISDTSANVKEKQIKSKDLGYFFYSPSKQDCSNQEALECQAMTLEPKSGFHFDPVIVCDFTALYPSLVIAYNLCYTTVAGKLDYHSTRREMRTSGKTTSRCGPFFYSERKSATVVKHHMKSLVDSQTSKRRRDRAYAIPTGSIFVSESVLKGVLPQVLDEMLSTRAMLKKAAKEYKKRVQNLSPAVLRQIEARQLALKYVANVTYGYTSGETFASSSLYILRLSKGWMKYLTAHMLERRCRREVSFWWTFSVFSFLKAFMAFKLTRSSFPSCALPSYILGAKCNTTCCWCYRRMWSKNTY